MTSKAERIRRALLRWYARAHRDLPWRRTRDPYAIWVSEIMLQQTRVETVIPYYHRFLDRFPTARALAAAPLDDVLALWSGLGYYRRARMLHAAAGVCLSDHGGDFPGDLAAACELPGIGRSTAGAIVSIGHGVRAPVLDGNVKRVLTRLFALRGDPDAKPLEAELWKLAEELVACATPGDVNQVLMELGATLCLPFAAARCDECPVARHCQARAEGIVAELPERKVKTALVAQTWAVAIARRDGKHLVRQRSETGLLRGMLEFPTTELEPEAARDAESMRAALAAFLREELGTTAAVGRELLLHRQVISNRKVTQHAFAVTLRGTPKKARWLAPAAIRALAITMATRRILARLETCDAEVGNLGRAIEARASPDCSSRLRSVSPANGRRTPGRDH